MKRIIKIRASSTDDFDFGIRLVVDGKMIVKHIERDLALAIRKLLLLMGHTDDDFEIIDER